MSEEVGGCEEILIQFEKCEKKLLHFLDDSGVAVSSDNAQVIQSASVLVEQLEVCVCQLSNVLPAPSPTLQLVTVKKVLWLCRHGEASKGFLFEALGLQLGSLFKVTYTMLKGCLDAAASANEQSLCWPQLDTFLKELTAVASLSLYFDPSLLALCWRSVGKLVCVSGSQRTPLSLETVIPELIEQLCVAIVTSTKQSVMEGDPLLVKRLKTVAESGKVIVDMLLSIHQTVHAVENVALRSKLESNLLLLREPLVECMSTDQNFLKVLLDISGVSCGQHYGWGLCLTALLKHFPSMPDWLQEYCLEAVSSREEASASCRVMDSVFFCLDHCHVGCGTNCIMCGVVCNGQQQCSESFFEWVCSHVFVLLSCLSDELLHHVEKNLVAHLLSSQPFSSQLASDCLTFIARLGGDAMVLVYCKFLIKLLLSLHPDNPSHSYSVLLVGSLLNRLLGLLPSAAQLSLLRTYVTHQSWLWAHIKVNSLHSETLRVLGPQLFSDSQSKLIESLTCNSFDLHNVGPSLYCLCAICQYSFIATSVKTNDVIEASLKLLQSSSLYCHELCLQLISHLLPALSPAIISQVFVKLSQLSSSPQPFSQTLAGCYILGYFASLHFHPSIQEASVSAMSHCYFSMLSIGHWLVRHHVLESFRAFAEMTPHTSAVELCVPPFLTDAVIQFLHKIPYKAKVYQARLHHGVLLSHPCHSLITLQVASEGASALRDLRFSWEKVQALEGDLSTELISQLITINKSISSFLTVLP